jgi:hypothetical protein
LFPLAARQHFEVYGFSAQHSCNSHDWIRYGLQFDSGAKPQFVYDHMAVQADEHNRSGIVISPEHVVLGQKLAGDST